MKELLGLVSAVVYLAPVWWVLWKLLAPRRSNFLYGDSPLERFWWALVRYEDRKSLRR